MRATGLKGHKGIKMFVFPHLSVNNIDRTITIANKNKFSDGKDAGRF
jgi:hypothetical protein